MRKCNLKDCTYFDGRENNNCDTHLDCLNCQWYLQENSIQLLPIKNGSYEDTYLLRRKLIDKIERLKIAIDSNELCKKYDVLFDNLREQHKSYIIKEFHNVIQTMLQLLIYEGITVEEIIQEQEKHFDTLEKEGWEL